MLLSLVAGLAIASGVWCDGTITVEETYAGTRPPVSPPLLLAQFVRRRVLTAHSSCGIFGATWGATQCAWSSVSDWVQPEGLPFGWFSSVSFASPRRSLYTTRRSIPSPQSNQYRTEASSKGCRKVFGVPTGYEHTCKKIYSDLCCSHPRNPSHDGHFSPGFAGSQCTECLKTLPGGAGVAETCPEGYIYQGSCDWTKGVNTLSCVACDRHNGCPDPFEYLAGTCSGDTDALYCERCETTQCGTGQYLTGKCTAGEDYTCADCNNAECEAEEYSSGTCGGFDNTKECHRCQNLDCPAGQVRSGSCTDTTQGYTCSPCERVCPTGQFLLADTCECDDHRNCGNGQYVTAEPTPTSERECGACDGDTFSIGENQLTCTPQAECAAGTYAYAQGTPTTKRTCRSCTSGTFTSTSNLAECAKHRDCEPGTYVEEAGSLVKDRDCTDVVVGQGFTNVPNQPTPTAVQGCLAGQMVVAAPTATSDRECAACEDGYFSTAKNAESCTQHTPPCRAGEWAEVMPSKTADRKCTTWTPCGAGQLEFVAPSATEDRFCLADPCIDSPCLNEGTCSAVKGRSGFSVECACKPGFEPGLCQKVCLPGEVELVRDADTVYLPSEDPADPDRICRPGTSESSSASSSPGAIAGIAVGVVIAVVLVALLVLRGRGRKTGGERAVAGRREAAHENPVYEASDGIVLANPGDELYFDVSGGEAGITLEDTGYDTVRSEPAYLDVAQDESLEC